MLSTETTADRSPGCWGQRQFNSNDVQVQKLEIRNFQNWKQIIFNSFLIKAYVVLQILDIHTIEHMKDDRTTSILQDLWLKAKLTNMDTQSNSHQHQF